ncbi:hypothetical protein NVS89_17410 [Ancylobacter sp. MQZ15Z-1]|uniref:Pectate lyase superfamily protein domain-containing protein n=1 Tax=Ancylobacter mangrovi TaxID=2972472 RepID=A0A9X2PIS3_9HYPH|nr:hypothetical protein [Ancylobacter mangrovi]MCS0496875.1 hypothetical protein [Ancylobacter mangrovi]
MIAYTTANSAGDGASANVTSEITSVERLTFAAAKARRFSTDVHSLVISSYAEDVPFSPATYRASVNEPSHPGKLQTADGRWWEMVDGNVSLFAFGAKGDGGDVFKELQDALDYLSAKGGGELFIPQGRFSFSKDVRILGHNITLRGVGPASRLSGTNNARLIVGKAELLPDGMKTGTKTIGTRICNLHVAPAGNHSGECVLLDFADNTTISDSVVGPFVLDGTTVAHGIKTNWVQYTEFRNVLIIVNGYGIYIVLPKTQTENEDHFSVSSSWIYCGKFRNKEFSPACLAIEREAGRGAAIFQLSLSSCHLGAFMSGDGDNKHTTGVKYISTEPVDSRLTHAFQLNNCMFEYVLTGIDMKSATHGDTSRVIMVGCSFLGQAVCLLGWKTKSIATVISSYFLQCGMIVDGPRVSFVGANVQTAVNKVSAQELTYHSFSDKYLPGSLSGVRLAERGVIFVNKNSSHVVIPHNMSGVPNSIRISTSWDTTWWLGGVSGSDFVVHFGSPAPKKMTLNWDAEL